ncbi:phosphatase PAP2 family protein [Nocardia sp. alder85J]|uniref:phosphatase PAP2 family protein n=1 Tax=Nocardia sp. alder85J TaxID=2862949 RepID=UPI001CD5DFBA|nr:phosphatase PAP2 family protein [Nocardia sp. alder85J]MCX4097135.1 phosphatase PAP2 family protein [Nocardia sp. alder85J]
MNVDQDILVWLSGHRTAALTTPARWAMNIGTGGTGALLAGLGFVAVVIAGRWREGVTVGVSVLAAQVSAKVLKHFIGRPRPAGELTVVRVEAFAMPSTVAAMTAAFAVAVYLLVPWRPEHRRYAGGLLAAGLVVIACAMVYLGAHWPTDVLAGWGLGALVGVVLVRSLRILSRRYPLLSPTTAGDSADNR